MPKLYYLIQRYKFESNSQHSQHQHNQRPCCIIWYKDTNLKAIHNPCEACALSPFVVLSDTKIQIWKQFTTQLLCRLGRYLLYYLIQRYKFESNSQLLICHHLFCHRCIIWYKDTNLKAIHNTLAACLDVDCVVLSDTKIQIWKQFTTHLINYC